MAHIAFCGLGTMGSGMAHNLLKAGHTLAVYNRTRSKGEPHAEKGARIASTPFDAAQKADVIINMVADDGAARTVWFGEQGALAAASPNTLLIECSTVTPAFISDLVAQATARGCVVLDAPVTGSRPQADAGELNFLVGGDAETIERARPILMAMGKNIYPFGPNGSGAMVKLINNMIVSVQVVSFAEGLSLAEQSGMDVRKVADYILQGPLGSLILKRREPAIINRDYTPNFALRWMNKDLNYGLDEAAQRDVPMPSVAAVRELIRIAMAQGWGDQDFTVFNELLRPKK